MYCPSTGKSRPLNQFISLRVLSSDGKFLCPECGQKCKHQTSFDMHMLLHSDARPFPCHYCEESFRSNGEMNRHIRLVHKLQPYVCHTCGMDFFLKSGLK
ncbi:hypothetical protein PMAYCL1PPCAC_19559, partial [Pristionchus mayeri]